MNNIIFDGKDYYFFRALNNENKRDKENGIQSIRAKSIQYYEYYGRWGKYDAKSEISVQEVYDHVKMRCRKDTNCISLTKDANVALTYNTENTQYVLVRIAPEDIGKIINVAEYLTRKILKKIEEIEGNLSQDYKVKNILEKIEETTHIEQIKKILKDLNPLISTATIYARQYLNKEEQMKVNKLNAKLKVLENEGELENILQDVSNSQLLATIGNAYTSAEYIYYREIPANAIIPCSPIFIDMFSLLQQAEQKGVSRNEIERLNHKILKLIEDGYDIDKVNNKFTNGKQEIDIDERSARFLCTDYVRKSEIRKSINLDKVYEMRNGLISYGKINMQAIAICLLAEMTLKKKAIEKILNKIFPEEQNIEKILEHTYCIHPELAIKQNGRGYPLSSTVNLLISEYGDDFGRSNTKALLNSMGRLKDDELLDIYNKGINSKTLNTLLISTKKVKEPKNEEEQKRIKKKYMVQGVIEGYDWRRTRRLTKTETRKLTRKMLLSFKTSEELENLYKTLQKVATEKQQYTQDEIYAIIMNIVIDEKVGDISYRELLEMKPEEQYKTLLENMESMSIVVENIKIDLLMKRGKTIEILKEDLETLGIESDFIETIDERNLYTAKEILDNYDFERKISNKEKCAILQAILNIKGLGKQYTHYISSIIRSLEDVGLTEQEAYGAIINLGIKGKIVNQMGYGYSDLLNSRLKTLELQKYKDNIETVVNENTINLAKTKEINEKEKQEIKSKYEKLGISKEFIDSINVRNLYIANQIIEEYDFKRNLSNEEKSAILQSILSQKGLEKQGSLYLTTLIENLREIGWTEHEAYGIIINLGIHGNIIATSGYGYQKLLGSKTNIMKLWQHKDEVKTSVKDVDIQVAIAKNLNKMQIGNLKIEYEDLGIPKEFISEINEKNLYIVKQIVDRYDFGRKISNEEEKAILQNMLDRKRLGTGYLTTILKELEKIGLTEQEIYGVIINLGINGSVIENRGYSYTELINNTKKVSELSQYKDKMETSVSNSTIKTALVNYLSEEKKKELKRHYEMLEISSEILDRVDERNLYMAKVIVDNYNFGKVLDKREEKAILQSIVGSKGLEKNNSCYLNTLAKKLEKIGLSEQEIFGTIINLGINKSIIEDTTYGYNNLLMSKSKTLELAQYKDIVDSKVSEMSIKKALANCLNDKEKKNLKKYYETLGISTELTQNIDERNLYMAKMIIDGYQFERELNTQEKRAILQSIIDKSFIRGNHMITGLAKNLEEIGLTEQEIYGTIINLGINQSMVENVGYGYSNLLTSKAKVLELAQYKDKIDSKVSEMKIQTALANRLDEKEKEILKRKYGELGISREFLDTVAERNLYMAKKIVEEYDFGRELTDEEKKSILLSMLDIKVLSKSYSGSLTSLAQNLEKTGLTKQQIYGTEINLGINKNIVPYTGYAYQDLLNSETKVLELSKYKDEMDMSVSEMTISKAIENKLHEQGIDDLKKEYENLGNPILLINQIDERNLYSAKKIVEGYDFGRALIKEEESAIKQCVLNAKVLQKNYHVYLSTLIKNLENIGLTEQEIYGTIINLGVNGNIVSAPKLAYVDLLGSSERVFELSRYKDEIETSVTDMTIIRAKADTLKEEDKQVLKRECKTLGVETEFIDNVDERNLYMAKRIVDGYEFGRKLNKEEERALIKAILSNRTLTNGGNVFLTTLVRNLEKIGLNKQEIYGTIINLGANGNVIDTPEYGYYNLLSSKDKILELAQYKDDIETKVSSMTIQWAMANQLNSESKKALKEEYEELKISQELIDEIDERNLYVSKRIVDEYNFSRKLNSQERRAILQSILNNKLLKRKNIYISKLEKNLERAGFTEQEIYGIIINLVVNERIIKENGYGYQILINNSEKALGLAQHKSEINTTVTDITIQTAETNQLSEETIEDLKRQYEDLGFLTDNIEEIHEKNLYTAKRIVDNYEFDRKLRDEEKRLLLQSILSPKILRKGRTSYLITIMKNLEKIGLTEQESYGAMMNLAINGNLIDNKEYKYIKVLNSPNGILELSKHKNQIKTNIDENMIQNLMKKAEKIIKKSVKQVREQGNIVDIHSTMNELEDMVTMEFLKDNPSKTNDVPDNDEQEL